MLHNRTAAVGRTDGPDKGPVKIPELLDVVSVAVILAISPRQVKRLVASGAIPAPVRLGHRLRWRRTEIEAWIAQGCPPITSTGQEESND